MISHPLTRRVALSLAAAAMAAGVMPGPGKAAHGSGWIIDADQARVLLAEGAVLFDTRGDAQRGALAVKGAVPVAWPAFTEADLPNKGKLLADDGVLTERLRALGVSAGRPVVVIADSRNRWGEDGRIVWTLRSLGKVDSFMVDGGVQALLAKGPVTLAPVGPGDFTVGRNDAYTVTMDQVRADLGRLNVVIVDAREPREYAGATPYGEARGGHVPGAQPLYFRDLVDGNGMVLQGDALRARLDALGVGPDTTVVSYCTGGIRSGFVTAVLQTAGIDARNYAGSMWEWAAGPAEDYPLETD